MFIMFVILFCRKNNTYPNKILAFILLLPAISFISNYYFLSEKIIQIPSFVFINQIAAFLLAPFIYHYFRIMMSSKDKIYILLHGISAFSIIACIYYWILFNNYNEQLKHEMLIEMINENYPSYLIRLRGIFFILLNIYFIHISVLVLKYSKSVFNIESNYEQFKTQYLKHFIIILWSLNFIILIIYQVIPNFYVDFIGVPVITNVFYFFIVRTGFTNNAIFTKTDFNIYKSKVDQLKKVHIKETKKELSTEEVEMIKNKLRYLLDEKMIFTDPDLGIEKLSKELEQTIHMTSFFINNYMNTNFFNLINLKRIELAKKKMQMRREKSEIEIIAFEVGFNSKSAFYRAFNRYLRQSPTDYIQSIGN